MRQKKLHNARILVTVTSVANQRETMHGTERIGRFPPVLRRACAGTEPAAAPLSAKMKRRQSSKIRELAQAVKSAGFLTLDKQAKALGLSRSTAWTIRKASHKASGLSASIINRMLAAPDLPPLARSKILEYIEEKAAGLYGGSRSQRRKFAARLSIKELAVYRETESTFPEHNGITRANRERSWVAQDIPAEPERFLRESLAEAD
jgi:hypothetical protein